MRLLLRHGKFQQKGFFALHQGDSTSVFSCYSSMQPVHSVILSTIIKPSVGLTISQVYVSLRALYPVKASSEVIAPHFQL